MKAARLIIDSLAAGGKLALCGNGGSAADAQHIAGELVGRFRRERKAIAAIALTTDTSIITAIGNDYGFDRIFARQVRGKWRPFYRLAMYWWLFPPVERRRTFCRRCTWPASEGSAALQ